MASNSTKSFLADAGYGEQELDANSALMELDKGTGGGKRTKRSGDWRHLWAAARGTRKAHAPMYGAGSAAASLGAKRWPCIVGAEARACEDVFDRLGAQSPVSQTANEINPKSTGFRDYSLKCSVLVKPSSREPNDFLSVLQRFV